MPRKPLPKGHKITVRFNDNELYEWLLKEAKETEREPDQQIRYFLRFIKGDIITGVAGLAASVEPLQPLRVQFGGVANVDDNERLAPK